LAQDDEPIIIEKMDRNFRDEITNEHGGENIKRCFTCGTCTVICPVFAVEERYDPRKIIRMILLGMKEEVLTNDLIWLCSGCYSCHELSEFENTVRTKKDIPELKEDLPEVKELLKKLGLFKLVAGGGSDE